MAAVSRADQPFAIRVIDAVTNRPVPLVELETVNHILHVTDSAGLVAFLEPGLMDREMYFSVRSHGYEMPADGFGLRGVRLRTVPGREAVIKLKRINIAERMYRLTGEGIYRDSLLLGRSVPLSAPTLNAGVMGCDSVQTALFQGQLYWFWGDTQLPRYPLGVFQATGATSQLPAQGGLSPAQGVDFNYFQDDKGQAAGVAPMPGDGPTWLSGLTVLKDDSGREHLFAGYAKIRPPLQAYQRGIAEFDRTSNRFQQRKVFAADVPLFPDGHPFRVTERDREYVYFASPFPQVRVPATTQAFLDLSTYEAYSCLKPGSRLEAPELDRTSDGKIHYAWKADTPPLDEKTAQQLIVAGKLRPAELAFQLCDIETGKRILAHSGSVAWNSWLNKYVMIALEISGTSMLGEIWYSEAADPLGPWSPARKIITHDKYSFYNPKHHPQLDEDGGRVIYFEATYTQTFSGNAVPTPRYDYNQLMYRLDLSDQRLRSASAPR
jgi:hypothetical protein